MATVNALNNDLSQSTSYNASDLNVQFTASYIGTTTLSNPAFLTPSTVNDTVYFTQGTINGIILDPVVYNNRLAFSSSTSVVSSIDGAAQGLMAIYNRNFYFNGLVNGGGKTLIATTSAAPTEGAPSFSLLTRSGYTSLSSTSSASGYSASAVFAVTTGAGSSNPAPNTAAAASSGSTYDWPVIANLPTVAVPGDTLTLFTPSNGGAFRVNQRAGEYIWVGNTRTTVGSSGYIIASSAVGGRIQIEMVCIETGGVGWAVLGQTATTLEIY